jgi:hypothetical protein
VGQAVKAVKIHRRKCSGTSGRKTPDDTSTRMNVSSSFTFITRREGEADACWQSAQPLWVAANSLMLTGGVLTGEGGDEAVEVTAAIYAYYEQVILQNLSVFDISNVFLGPMPRITVFVYSMLVLQYRTFAYATVGLFFARYFLCSAPVLSVVALPVQFSCASCRWFFCAACGRGVHCNAGTFFEIFGQY